MKLPHKAHVAVVDGNRFMLLQNTGDPFEPTLKMVEEPDLSPSNFSAGVRHQDDAGQRTGATDLNELAHGAAHLLLASAGGAYGDGALQAVCQGIHDWRVVRQRGVGLLLARGRKAA